MTVSSAPSPIWVTDCRIRRWETFCAATALPPLRSEARPPRGGISLPRIWMSWPVRTSLRLKCSPGGAGDLLRLFFFHLGSRRVNVAGITRNPDQEWMEQIARSANQETWGYLHPCRCVLHDRDTKFCAAFRSVLAEGGVKVIPLPARSPNLNAFAERWVRSVKQVCLSKLILFGERPLLRALAEFSTHYHHDRNHQGKGNKLLFPHAGDEPRQPGHTGACRQRLGGLLKYYGSAA